MCHVCPWFMKKWLKKCIFVYSQHWTLIFWLVYSWNKNFSKTSPWGLRPCWKRVTKSTNLRTPPTNLRTWTVYFILFMYRFVTKDQCHKAMDPYCGWNRDRDECTVKPTSDTSAWSQQQLGCPAQNLPVSWTWLKPSFTQNNLWTLLWCLFGAHCVICFGNGSKNLDSGNFLSVWNEGILKQLWFFW